MKVYQNSPKNQGKIERCRAQNYLLLERKNSFGTDSGIQSLDQPAIYLIWSPKRVSDHERLPDGRRLYTAPRGIRTL